MAKRKLLLVAEVDIQDPDEIPYEADPDELARLRLDAFREAVQPGAEHGIVLYRAQFADVEEFLLDTSQSHPADWVPGLEGRSEPERSP